MEEESGGQSQFNQLKGRIEDIAPKGEEQAKQRVQASFEILQRYATRELSGSESIQLLSKLAETSLDTVQGQQMVPSLLNTAAQIAISGEERA